jgi:hypothetical protein
MQRKKVRKKEENNKVYVYNFEKTGALKLLWLNEG